MSLILTRDLGMAASCFFLKAETRLFPLQVGRALKESSAPPPLRLAVNRPTGPTTLRPWEGRLPWPGCPFSPWTLARLPPPPRGSEQQDTKRRRRSGLVNPIKPLRDSGLDLESPRVGGGNGRAKDEGSAEGRASWANPRCGCWSASITFLTSTARQRRNYCKTWPGWGATAIWLAPTTRRRRLRRFPTFSFTIISPPLPSPAKNRKYSSCLEFRRCIFSKMS